MSSTTALFKIENNSVVTEVSGPCLVRVKPGVGCFSLNCRGRTSASYWRSNKLWMMDPKPCRCSGNVRAHAGHCHLYHKACGFLEV